MGGEDVASGRALRGQEQVGGEIRFPAREEPLLAGGAGAVAVVAVGFGDAGQAAAGGVPTGADAFESKAMTRGHLPVEAREADPLRSGARRGAEELIELLEAGGRVTRRGNAEVVVVRLVLALA